MTPDSGDLDTRWVDGANTSLELRSALRSLRVEPSDAARVTRLEARLALLLGAVPQPDLPSDASLGNTGAAAPTGATSGAATFAGGAMVKLVPILVVAGGLVAGARAFVPSTATAPASVSPVVRRTTEVLSASAPRAPEIPSLTFEELPPALPSAAPRADRLPEIPHDVLETPSVAEEARALQEARSKIQSAPEQALVLLTAHGRRYPHSTLGDERELFTIQALVRAGRTSDAASRLERFRTTSPSSPYLGAASRAVEGAAR